MVLVLVQVLALSVWFSVSAVLPALRGEWMLGRAGGIWLTATVQIGFVVAREAEHDPRRQVHHTLDQQEGRHRRRVGRAGRPSERPPRCPWC